MWTGAACVLKNGAPGGAGSGPCQDWCGNEHNLFPDVCTDRAYGCAGCNACTKTCAAAISTAVAAAEDEHDRAVGEALDVISKRTWRTEQAASAVADGSGVRNAQLDSMQVQLGRTESKAEVVGQDRVRLEYLPERVLLGRLFECRGEE